MISERFEMYVNKVTSKIMDPILREEAQEELHSHLEDKWEDLSGSQKSDNEKTESILKDMGDSDQLTDMLGMVHSGLPALYIRQSLGLLLFGFILCLIDADIGFFGWLLKGTGMLLCLSGAGKLKSCNQTLRYAFVACIIWICGTVLMEIFKYVPRVELQQYYMCFELVQGLLPFLFMQPLGEGLDQIICQAIRVVKGDNSGKKSYKLFCSFFGVIYLFWVIIGINRIFFSFIIAGQLYAVQKYLWDNQIGQYSGKLKLCDKFAIGISGIFVFVLPIISAIILYSLPPITKDYVKEDISTSAEVVNHVDTIRSALISDGLSEELINMLPQSEIMKCQDYIDLEVNEYTRELDDKFEPFNQVYIDTGNKAGIIHITIGIVKFEDNSFRSLNFIYWKKAPDKRYFDRVAINWNDSESQPLASEDTLLIFLKEDGKLKTMLPTSKSYNDITDSHRFNLMADNYPLAAFSYKVLDEEADQCLYWAQTRKTGWDPSYYGRALYLTYWHQSFLMADMDITMGTPYYEWLSSEYTGIGFNYYTHYVNLEE